MESDKKQGNQYIYIGSFGLLDDREFRETLFGTDVPTTIIELFGYEKRLATREELPEGISIDLPETFRIWGLRPGEGNVTITVLALTEKQKLALDELNFNGELYDSHMQDVEVNGVMLPVIVDTFKNDIGRPMTEDQYAFFPNSSEGIYTTARNINRGFFPEQYAVSGKERI